MERKKTTDLTSSSSRAQMKDQDTHFHPAPRFMQRDVDYSHLNENDCWFYQNELERTIRANVPDSMSGRVVAMLWHLGAQARKAKTDA